jgi:hypothetical protein
MCVARISIQLKVNQVDSLATSTHPPTTTLLDEASSPHLPHLSLILWYVYLHRNSISNITNNLSRATIMSRYSLRPNIQQRLERHETSFPFLKLPAEIRNKIYQLVVVSSSPITPLKSGRKRVLGLDIYDNLHHVQPSFTKVSRQIRLEALPLYYSKNVFRFGRCRIPLEDFEKVGVDNLKYIRAIEVIPSTPSYGDTLRVIISPDDTTFLASFSCWSNRRRGIGENFTEEEMQIVVENLKKDTGLAELEKVTGLTLVKIVREVSVWEASTPILLRSMIEKRSGREY